jgi:Na+-transporting methylmalonyl-CoA/oxaloacetate decarboxylase gamma subunit
MQIVERLPSLTPTDPAEETKEETVVVPVEEDEENVEIIDDKPLQEEKNSSWDGEKIGSDGSWGAWFNEEAFSIGGRTVTNEEAAAGAGATLIVIIVLVVICCIVSFIERKKIQEEARRASTGIRNSIRRMTGASQPDADEAQAPKTDAEIK